MRVVEFSLLGGWLLMASAALSQQPGAPARVEPKTPSAQQAGAKIPLGASPTTHSLESSDLAAFFDGIIPLQLERSDIAGASVLVMKDGKILLQEGYGYADAKKKKSVDPASTIFRLASISKLFTWVSIMQLQEQGKLDLDTDVNAYLDFQIRPAFATPITLRNLMTHTGGFEEETRELILIDPKGAPTLREFLIANQPRRLFPAGVIPGYSNYGVGLGSYIVERVSGEPFEQYVAEHIFVPLAMNHSTFSQPPQRDLADFPSEGYRANTQKPAVGFEIFNPVGAGGISSTASDMGRFGQALLNGGELDSKRILKSDTVAAMMMPQFRVSEQMPALGMGFYETWRNDLRWIGHEGDLIAFHSLFFIERAQKLILFVSFNSSGAGGKARPELVQMFSDRYFPTAKKQIFVSVPLNELRSMEGTYQSTRRADSTKVSVSYLISQHTATVDKDGELQFEDFRDLRGHTIKWKPIGKDLLQQLGDQRRLFAIRDSSGRVVRLAYDFPGVQAERVRWYENAKLVLPALGFSVTTLLLAVLAPFIRAIRRLVFSRRPPMEPQPGTRWLPRVTQVGAWIWVLLFCSLFIFLSTVGGDFQPPTRDWDKYFYLINAVTSIGVLFSVFAIFSALLAWLRRDLRHITRIKFTLVAFSCLFLTWFAIHWNILGPATRF